MPDENLGAKLRDENWASANDKISDVFRFVFRSRCDDTKEQIES